MMKSSKPEPLDRLLTSAVAGFSAVGSALAQEPIPVLDPDDPQKSVVVELRFFDFTQVEVADAEVILGASPARAGGPQLLGVEIVDLNGATIDRFNAWNPLYFSIETPDGGEEDLILDEATGSIIFPLFANAATMNVVDLEADTFLLSVDLIPPVHEFCRSERDDPDCQRIANRLPACDAGGPYRAECEGPSTPVNVTLDGSRSSDPDQDPLSFFWTRASGSQTSGEVAPTFQFRDLGVESVGLTVRDDWQGVGTCTALVEVADTVAPELAISVSRSALWPPNHKMTTVTVDADVTDVCDRRPTCRITGVTSDEPVDGPGDGYTSPDWSITGDLTVQLRAERSGRGDGRTYTIAVACADASGNSATQAVEVMVPRSR